MRSPIVLSCMLLLASCSPSAGPAKAAQPMPAAGNGSEIERFFPLEDGKIYHYLTKDGTDTGMLVAKVKRIDATHGELRLSNATKRFQLSPAGVAYDGGGAFILKSPPSAGTSWLGEHGGTTTIVATDAAVDVPAGHYTMCLKTIEEGGRPPGSRYETTFCPGVGMVLLVVSAAGTEARAELKTYGLPVKFE